MATIVIIAGGMYSALTGKGAPNQKRKTTITRILVGGYLVALIVSVLDLLGAPVQALTSALLLTAVLTTVIGIAPDFLGRVGAFSRGEPAAPSNFSGGPGGHPSIH